MGGDEDGIHSAEETLLQLETASEAPSSPCHSLLRRRRSMDHIDIMSRSTTDSEAPLLSTSQGSKRKDRKNIFSNLFGKEKDKEKKKEPNKENDEDLFDILSRVQGSRIDDQRAAKSSTTKKEDIENLLAQISGINGPN